MFVHRRLGSGIACGGCGAECFLSVGVGSACILNDNERSMRAEELRLVVRGVDGEPGSFDFDGACGRRQKWVESKRAGRDRGYEGVALPEDVLVRGRTFLDWVVPALASSPMRVQWPEEAALGDAQVEIALHEPSPMQWCRAAADVGGDGNGVVCVCGGVCVGGACVWVAPPVGEGVTISLLLTGVNHHH